MGASPQIIGDDNGDFVRVEYFSQSTKKDMGPELRPSKRPFVSKVEDKLDASQPVTNGTKNWEVD